jgi:tetratricopeptide (TPR) repeat protein
MKKILLLAFIFSSASFIYSADISDVYYNADSFLDSLSDPNTGLTAFPTLLIPMGGRFEAMGTAFTAVADDSSYIEANPAGSATLTYTELTFYHNDWIADTNIESITYTTRKQNFGFGAAGKFLYVPFTEYNTWGERESKGYYSESVMILNASYNFFSSYDFFGLSVGSNLKVAYRNIPEKIYPGQSAVAVMTDLGVLTRFNFLKFYSSRNKNTSFGLVVKNLGLKTLDDPLPMETVAGVAYSPLRPVILTFDLTLPLSLNPSKQPAEKLSFATGLDVTVTEFFSVQSGFRYRGSNPRFSLGSRMDLEEISFNVNYTLDLTTQVGLDRFSVTSSLNLGDRGRSITESEVDAYYIEGLKSYAEGDLEEAIINWEKALELNPGFTPAVANLITAKKTLQLIDEMQSLQTVE